MPRLRQAHGRGRAKEWGSRATSGQVALVLALGVGMGASLVGGCGGKAGPYDATNVERHERIERSFGETGLSPGQFAYPRCMDSDGRDLWVIDKVARVQRIDGQTGASVVSWRMPEWEKGKPTGVTVWTPAEQDEDEYVFVADTHYHRVMVYRVGAPTGDRSREPELVTQFGEYGEGPGQFIYPTDIAVEPTEDGGGVARLWVSEYGGNDRISVFEPVHEASVGDAGGSVRREAMPTMWRCERTLGGRSDGGAAGGGDAGGLSFSRPQSLVLDFARKRLLIADACNHRLIVADLEGAVERTIGSMGEVGEEPGRFSYPYGLELLDDGSVLVSEFGNCRVQRIDPGTGACLGVYGGRGRGLKFLAMPWAVASIGGEAYVLDSGHDRVAVYELPQGVRAADDRSGRGAIASGGAH